MIQANATNSVLTKKFSTLLFFCILTTFCSIESYGQSTTVDLGYRINPIYSRGFRQPLYEGDRAGFFTMQRTRLMLNYSNKDSLNAQVILQDRRAWGEASDRADISEVAIFRAWVEKYFTPELSIKLGRQGLIYDEQNIFGGLDWAGTLAHDVALTKYESNKIKAHLALAFNANRVNELKRDFFRPNLYKNLQFLWVRKEWEKVKSSFWFVNHGLEKADTTVAYTQTIGTNTQIQLNPRFRFRGIYFQQIGRDVTNRKVNAHFLSTHFTYLATSNLRLTLALDKMSGSNVRELNDPSAKSKTYDNLFGLRHGRFGYLDYFYLLIEPTAGLQDYYVKLDYSPSNKLIFKNLLHYFRTDQDSYAAGDLTFSNPLNSFLGVENDLVVTYKFSNDFNASFGHSIMFGSNTLDQMFGGRESQENQVFYMVIEASPRLFEKKAE